ncbi:MAG: hypothetical protein IT542_00130 [Rubellimicrobium sp.]|nr:hypothetical protein [Rubellimicrobium sp.]
MALFADREDAARALIRALPSGIGPDWIILALPRGGVPIAARIAAALGAASGLMIVRKVGAPGNPELALAAVSGPGPDGMVTNADLCRHPAADLPAVGLAYDAFPQVPDEEVTRLLAPPPPSPSSDASEAPA